MIVKTRLGALVAGTVARDPEVKTLGNSDVLILNVKAQSEKDDAGRWKSLFVDVQCWGGLTERDGMYRKGDFVAAFGREIKTREFPEGSGKFYHSLSADGILPGDLTVLRWMQQVVDMIPDGPTQAPPAMAETDEGTPFDAPAPQPEQTNMAGVAAAEKRPPDVPPPDIPQDSRLYPGETLGDYAPRGRQPVPEDDLTRQLDATDADDLPF